LQTEPDCCGNKLVEAPEECDDGNLVSSDACVACKKATCGDGVRQLGVEPCDGGDLGPDTCASLLGAGYVGPLSCGAGCKYDTSKCTGPLGTINNPAASCKAILDGGWSTGNGVYYLKVGNTPVKAWCDMAGGGWTLVTSWPHVPTTGVWGEFTTGLDDPAPGKQHAQAFRTLFPHPTEVKMTYLGNNQTLTFSISPTASWATQDNGCRIQLTDGRHLIFELLHCQPGQGVCVCNGAYGSGMNCDGDAGQIAGQGMFNHCTQNEFCGCGTFGWKYSAGGCSPDVCGPAAQLAVYLR
jgi:cysteine-rich repeat protein